MASPPRRATVSAMRLPATAVILATMSGMVVPVASSVARSSKAWALAAARSMPLLPQAVLGQPAALVDQTVEPMVLLFRDRQLVDATPPARTLLSKLHGDGDWPRLMAWLSMRFDALGPAFDALEKAGVDVRGMAHITGGGLVDNPPRVFPQGIGMEIDTASWTVPPLFELIVNQANVPRQEAFRALNMGVGFLFIVPQEQAAQAMQTLQAAGETPWVIGRMIQGQGVAFVAGRP